jgi:hypothetical protein
MQLLLGEHNTPHKLLQGTAKASLRALTEITPPSHLEGGTLQE